MGHGLDPSTHRHNSGVRSRAGNSVIAAYGQMGLLHHGEETYRPTSRRPTIDLIWWWLGTGGVIFCFHSGTVDIELLSLIGIAVILLLNVSVFLSFVWPGLRGILILRARMLVWHLNPIDFALRL